MHPIRPASADRSLGRSLGHHPPGPPYVDVDRLPLADIKQDAYRRAYQDALRHHLGRGRNPGRRAARWQRLVSLENGLRDIAAPRQQEAFDRVPHQVAAVACLAASWSTGLPGVSLGRTRRLLRALRLAQRLKADGTLVVPPHLRERISRLRRTTGLPLTTRPL